jgi:hypothetical protein
MTDDLEARIIQTLKDGKALLYHWQKTIGPCPDCQKLTEETSPYMAGLNSLLKELGVEK